MNLITKESKKQVKIKERLILVENLKKLSSEGGFELQEIANVLKERYQTLSAIIREKENFPISINKAKRLNDLIKKEYYTN